MENEITIDGVQYIRKDLVKRQEKEENQKKKPLTGYERAENGRTYWGGYGYMCSEEEEEEGTLDDDVRYTGAVYYTSEVIALNNARADRLMRRLRQWQALNDDVCDWNDTATAKWYIAYNYMRNILYSDVHYFCKVSGVIYFSTKDKAKEAIEVFHDELMWYFTEYQSRLDESERGSLE